MMSSSQTYLGFVSQWTAVTLKLSSQVLKLLLHQQQNSNLPHIITCKIITDSRVPGVVCADIHNHE